MPQEIEFTNYNESLPISKKCSEFFNKIPNDPVYKDLAVAINHTLDTLKKSKRDGAVVSSTALNLSIAKAALEVQFSTIQNTSDHEKIKKSVREEIFILMDESLQNYCESFSVCNEYADKAKLSKELSAEALFLTTQSQTIFQNSRQLSNEELKQRIQAYQTKTENFFKTHFNEDIVTKLKETLVKEHFDPMTKYACNVRKAKESLDDIRKTKPEDFMAQASAEASLLIQQAEIDEINYKQQNKQLQQVNYLFALGQEYSATRKICKLGSTLTTIGQSGYTIFWNIANYSTLAAASGPLAPIVAVAGALHTLWSLLPGSDQSPSAQQIIKKDLDKIFNEVRESRVQMQQMSQDFKNLIFQKDGEDFKRYSNLKETISVTHRQVIEYFNLLIGKVDDTHDMLDKLSENIAQWKDDIRTIFEQKESDDYRTMCANAFKVGISSLNKRTKYWNDFENRIIRRSISTTFTGFESFKPIDFIKPVIHQVFLNIRFLQKHFFDIVKIPRKNMGELPNLLIWAEGMIDAMEFISLFPSSPFSSKEEEETWAKMRNTGEKLEEFIITLKAHPHFWQRLINQYKSSVIAVQEEIRALTDKEAILTLLKNNTEYGRRITEKQCELVNIERDIQSLTGESSKSEDDLENKQSSIKELEEKLLLKKENFALAEQTYSERLQKAELMIKHDQESFSPFFVGFMSTCTLGLMAVGAEGLAEEKYNGLNATHYLLRTCAEKKSEAYLEKEITELKIAHAKEIRSRLLKVQGILKSDIKKLEGDFIRAYNKSNDEIYREYLSHLAPNDQSERIKVSAEANTKNSPLQKALDKVDNNLQLLVAFMCLAFQNNVTLQTFLGQMWSKKNFIDCAIAAAQPISIVPTKKKRKKYQVSLEKISEPEAPVYEQIAAQLLPQLEKLSQQLLMHSSYCLELQKQKKPVPTENDILTLVSTRIAEFDQIMKLRKLATINPTVTASNPFISQSQASANDVDPQTRIAELEAKIATLEAEKIAATTPVINHTQSSRLRTSNTSSRYSTFGKNTQQSRPEKRKAEPEEPRVVTRLKR